MLRHYFKSLITIFIMGLWWIKGSRGWKPKEKWIVEPSKRLVSPNLVGILPTFCELIHFVHLPKWVSGTNLSVRLFFRPSERLPAVVLFLILIPGRVPSPLLLPLCPLFTLPPPLCPSSIFACTNVSHKWTVQIPSRRRSGRVSNERRMDNRRSPLS